MSMVFRLWNEKTSDSEKSRAWNFQGGAKGTIYAPYKIIVCEIRSPNFHVNRKDIGLGNIEGPYLFSVKFADKSANLVEKCVHTLKLENNTMNIVGLFREAY